MLKSILKPKTIDQGFISLDPPVIKKSPQINFVNLFDNTSPRDSDTQTLTSSTRREAAAEQVKAKLARSRRRFKRISVGRKNTSSEKSGQEE